jgi:FkbH-like protein
VAVPNVGNDVIDFIDFIDRNGYFEPISVSKDDIKRNEYYKTNNLRSKEKATFANYGEFLVSLEMKAQIFSFSEIYLERIAQLTNKTNQFNLTTKRYSLPEIENIAHDPRYIKVYGKLADKFGDNGLISIIVGRLKNDTCLIDLWLMSCRVLKRDMESAMLDDLVRRCRSLGVTKIKGNYYNT